MKKVSLIAAVVILFAAAATAQRGSFGRRSTITVVADGLSCTSSLGAGTFQALTWSFTATDALSSGGGTGSGGGSGKVTSAASITKRVDVCTPKLFEAVVEGKHFEKVTLTHQDERGHIYKVTLNQVLISSDQLLGDESEARPTEQLSFVFASFTIEF